MVAFEPGRVNLAASQLQEFRRPTRRPRNHTLKCAFVVRGAAAAALWSRGIRNAARCRSHARSCRPSASLGVCAAAMEEVPGDDGQPAYLSDSAVISAMENR